MDELSANPNKEECSMKKQVDHLKKTLKLQSSMIRNLRKDDLRSVAGGDGDSPNHTNDTCQKPGIWG
jgi:hypothetical protein